MNPNDSQYKFLRKMSPQQKLEAAMNLYYSAKELKSAWLSQIHSEWSNQKIKQNVYWLFSPMFWTKLAELGPNWAKNVIYFHT